MEAASKPRAALAALVLLWGAALWLYWPTATSMAATWNQSDTFAHGWVVPLISAWLVWRQRAALVPLGPSIAPAPSALIGVALAGAAWLLGEAAAVNALRQFALVAMLVALVPAVAGWPLARALAFPLGFLFFAVPFGEFLLPTLIAYTADFTVFALRLTGIPVLLEGNQISIPSGNWSVVEACSGVRYLIASMMVGALFSYLHYRSARRRLLFMLVAIAVPIVANWLRAYMIVMLGHLSGNKLAVGVDHLIYGWVFFGIVIGLMIFIGSRWSEADVGDAPVHASAPARLLHAPALAGWVAVSALVLATPIGAAWHADRAVDASAPRLAVPATLAARAASAPAAAHLAPTFVNPAASLAQTVLVGKQPVGLYIAYYRNQNATAKLVSSVNVVVSSDDPRWIRVGTGVHRVALPGGGDSTWRTLDLKSRGLVSETSMTVWQAYWVDGRMEASDVRAKLRSAWQRLAGRGDDGAAIVIHTSAADTQAAHAALEAFVREHLAAIQTQLRAARDGD
ncbi:MAG TPA: exosortase A [Burkholderiaceae bacterium]|nr:exosortase A [Burkholderiaceae bacterium]